MSAEYEFYNIVKETLEHALKEEGWHTDFEVTGHPINKKIPERFLRSDVLKNHQRSGYGRLPTPDVMGLVWSIRRAENKKLVIVEFKKSPKFWDIFQAKGYHELFRSDFTLLLGQEPIRDSDHKVIGFLQENRDLLRTNDGKYIAVEFLNKSFDGIISSVRSGADIGILPDDIVTQITDTLA
jgi:hypothetical protein